MKQVRTNIQRQSESGVVAVEFAIILPLLALLLAGILEVGMLARDQQVIQNAAREGAHLAAVPTSNPLLFANLAAWEVFVEDTIIDYLAHEGITGVTRADIAVTPYAGIPGTPATQVTITYDRPLMFGLFGFLGNPVQISASSVFANLYF